MRPLPVGIGCVGGCWHLHPSVGSGVFGDLRDGETGGWALRVQPPAVLIPPLPMSSKPSEEDSADFARSKITGLRKYLEENDDEDDEDDDWDD